MSMKRKELEKAAIYTSFYLANFVQGIVPDETKDKIFDLIVDNFNVMGAVFNLDELKQLDQLPKEKALIIVRNIKSKALNAIDKSCGPSIKDWFELTFIITLLDTGPETLSEFEPHLKELATRVGFPIRDFAIIIEGFRTPNHKNFLKIFIEKSLEIVSFPYIFISHATKDYELAVEFSKLFEKKNIKSFVANIDILPGTDWYEQLRGEIYKSDELLLILSPESMRSDWVMIEVGAAWALNKIITPAVIYADLLSAPEPIKKFQAQNITTSSARKKLVEVIAKRIYTE